MAGFLFKIQWLLDIGTRLLRDDHDRKPYTSKITTCSTGFWALWPWHIRAETAALPRGVKIDCTRWDTLAALDGVVLVPLNTRHTGISTGVSNGGMHALVSTYPSFLPSAWVLRL